MVCKDCLINKATKKCLKHKIKSSISTPFFVFIIVGIIGYVHSGAYGILLAMFITFCLVIVILTMSLTFYLEEKKEYYQVSTKKMLYDLK